MIYLCLFLRDNDVDDYWSTSTLKKAQESGCTVILPINNKEKQRKPILLPEVVLD